MIGRIALLVTFKKVKPKPQSLSRSHIRDIVAHDYETDFNHSVYDTLFSEPRTEMALE